MVAFDLTLEGRGFRALRSGAQGFPATRAGSCGAAAVLAPTRGRVRPRSRWPFPARALLKPQHLFISGPLRPPTANGSLSISSGVTPSRFQSRLAATLDFNAAPKSLRVMRKTFACTSLAIICALSRRAPLAGHRIRNWSPDATRARARWSSSNAPRGPRGEEHRYLLSLTERGVRPRGRRAEGHRPSGVDGGVMPTIARSLSFQAELRPHGSKRPSTIVAAKEGQPTRSPSRWADGGGRAPATTRFRLQSLSPRRPATNPRSCRNRGSPAAPGAIGLQRLGRYGPRRGRCSSGAAEA